MQKPLPVKGYTDQTDEKIALVDENKILEELVLRQIDAHREKNAIDQRLVDLAHTKIQEGFMLLNRSVFQPGRLTDDQLNGSDALLARLENKQ